LLANRKLFEPRYFPENPPARIFINVPAWNGGFDIEVDCIAAVL
jgi:2-iminobutanoate/2-iminopropanoate deaminase